MPSPAIAVIAVVLCVAAILALAAAKLSRRARHAGVDVSVADIGEMAMLELNPRRIVDALITARLNGVGVTKKLLMGHQLAHGDAIRLVDSLVAAAGAGVPIPPQTAASHLLIGGDPANVAAIMRESRDNGSPLSLDEARRLDLERCGIIAKSQQT